MLRVGRSRNGDHPVERPQPCEGDLRGVTVEVGQTIVVEHGAACERRVGGEDPVVLAAPVPERMLLEIDVTFRLENLQRGVVDGQLELLDGEVGDADVQRQSRSVDTSECRQRGADAVPLDRPMDEEEVDVVGLQRLEAGLDGAHQVVGLVMRRARETDCDVSELLAGAFGGFLDPAIRRSDFGLGWMCTVAWVERELEDHGVESSMVDDVLVTLETAGEANWTDQILDGDRIDQLGGTGRWQLALLGFRFGQVLTREAIPSLRCLLRSWR